MTNTAMLDDYIKKSGLKKSFLADAIGVTRQGFSLKCNNKGEFRASEIDTLCKILNIGVKDRMAIFFAN
jgi:DNA-binding Xre family transcriptional regulator